MRIYRKKRLWKFYLFSSAIVIIGITLWYSNTIVRKIAEDERVSIRLWANAVQRRASLVKYTREFFDKLKNEERRRVELLAEATKRLVYAESSEEITFYSEIISNNTTIPVIQTDIHGNITGTLNIDFDTSEYHELKGELKKEFTRYDPVMVNVYGNVSILYYKDSKTSEELRTYLNDLVNSFFSDVVINSASVPVIITDESKKEILEYGNISNEKRNDSLFLQKTLESMKDERDPIMIDLGEDGTRYIYWQDSYLLTQIRYYPIVWILLIAVLILVSYQLFSTARKSEQNQVWVGMSKETAHQLGTPLSSIMAWVEILRMKNIDKSIVEELEKDVHRLERVTERFSKIGSLPKLKQENIVGLAYRVIEYLEPRTPKKVGYSILPAADKEIFVPVNLQLFEWVIENLTRNAIDAMGGSGHITIEITEDKKRVYLDLSDTGKGIPKSQHKSIFHPGFTSKKRGWGLGLSLSQRIIKDYHKGKIFVKQSVVNRGTTFRIALKK